MEESETQYTSQKIAPKPYCFYCFSYSLIHLFSIVLRQLCLLHQVRSNTSTLYPESSFPLILISDFRFELHMLRWQTSGSISSLVFYFALISIVFRTNQIRACNGIFQSRSFRKACAARRVPRYKLGGGVQPATQSLYSIYDQNLRLSNPIYDLTLNNCFVSDPSYT